MNTPVYFSTMKSPLGRLLVTSNGEALTSLSMPGEVDAPTPAPHWIRADDRFRAVRRELEEYFAGSRRAFDLPLELRGTPFQKRVWRALLRIPFGQTRSYGEIARAVGAPRAFRAVGGANHRNPIAIIVPCHRVIGSDGSLTGYASGEKHKRRLLELEGALS